MAYSKDAPAVKPPSYYIIYNEYFKDAKTYPDVKKIFEETKRRKEEIKREKRVCIHIGCGKEFTDEDLEDKDHPDKAECKCHPGTWVFGYTGQSLRMFMELSKKIAENEAKEKKDQDPRFKNKLFYKDHWSCCGGGWNSEPCKKVTHYGPLKSYFKNYPEAKYPWPKRLLQLSYKKSVSSKWKEFLDKNSKTEAQLRYTIKNSNRTDKQFVKNIRYMRRIKDPQPEDRFEKDYLPYYKPSYEWERINDKFIDLCDYLKIGQFCLQEEPDYQLKFYDLIEAYEKGSAEGNTCAYFCKGDKINLDLFIKWWLTDYETLWLEVHPEDRPDNQEEKKEDKKK